jgi:hypothetical protein
MQTTAKEKLPAIGYTRSGEPSIPPRVASRSGEGGSRSEPGGVLRFWNNEIDWNLEGVLTLIDEALRGQGYRIWRGASRKLGVFPSPSRGPRDDGVAGWLWEGARGGGTTNK